MDQEQHASTGSQSTILVLDDCSPTRAIMTMKIAKNDLSNVSRTGWNQRRKRRITVFLFLRNFRFAIVTKTSFNCKETEDEVTSE
uniref:Uncharacterized protein n=1 Tax=Vespula pensylvanica TaxID=30213 RepID=A0A834UBG5_VESPE|nr:hypothetical protein H0235_007257 [Vespula pensylvanica]